MWPADFNHDAQARWQPFCSYVDLAGEEDKEEKAEVVLGRGKW